MLDKIESVSSDLKREIRGTQEMCVEICKECKELVKEINVDLKSKLHDLEKRYEQKFEELRREISNSKPEIKTIDRRKNIVISGGKFHLDKQGVAMAVEKLFKKDLQVEVDIDEVTVINQGGKSPKVLVKLLRMEDKKSIMKKKMKLRALNEFIYINDDLTKDEREDQRKVREIAKKERAKGKTVKIGFKKLNINGKWVGLNEYKGNA